MENQEPENNSNKAGDTETTGREYVKRESGQQDVPAVPSQNPGHTSPNEDDLENPKQDANRPHPKDEAIADQIKETNKE